MSSKIKKPIHSQEDIDTLLSRAFPAKPDVCSNCRAELCDGCRPTHPSKHWLDDGVHHSAALNLSLAHAACTRAKLVEVPPGWAGACPLWRGIGPTARDTMGVCRLDSDISCAGDEPLPSGCPLTDDDGKPNAGVRIVAIKEDEG